jgi:hypothetical protein
MELEQLKKSWDKLSEKLDREEVLREADRLGIAIEALRTELPPAPTRP